MKKALLAAALIGLLVGGCTYMSAKDKLVVDHRAAVMNPAADRVNACTFEQLKDNEVLLFIAYTIECERRAAVNLSDAAHWREPTYKYKPKMPTSLPWKPEDEVSK